MPSLRARLADTDGFMRDECEFMECNGNKDAADVSADRCKYYKELYLNSL